MFPFDIISQDLGLSVIASRLLCALIIGGVIGLERENAHRPAGMRTHMLVALGSCAVMITGHLLFREYHALGANADPARLSAQVIAGVGFLGAGTIIREGASVKGLTTAASIWTVACLGIAVGAGYLFVGLIGTGFMLMTLVVFEWVQKKLLPPRYASYTYVLICKDVSQAVHNVNYLAGRHNAVIKTMHTAEESAERHRVTIQAAYRGKNVEKRSLNFFAEVSGDRNNYSVKAERNEA